VLAAGRVASALGLSVAAFGLVPALRRRAIRGCERLVDLPGLAGIRALVRRTADWSDATRRRVLGAGLAGLGVSLIGFVLLTTGKDPDALYREGLEVFASGRLRESLPYLEEARRLAPLSETSFHARYFEATVYLREEEWEEAERRFRALAEGFPEARNAPEAWYHVGLARSRMGDVEAALAAWQETARRFPDSVWAEHARARIEETRGRPG
jgi:TolA-binding protein